MLVNTGKTEGNKDISASTDLSLRLGRTLHPRSVVGKRYLLVMGSESMKIDPLAALSFD